MKKITILLLMLMMALSFCACGSNADDDDETDIFAEEDDEDEDDDDDDDVSASYKDLVDGIDWDFSETKKDHAIHVKDIQYDLCTDKNGNKFATVWAQTDKGIRDVVEEKGESYPVLGLKIAHQKKDDIEEFDIPGNIMFLDSRCFEDCDILKKVSVPDSVIYMGENVFSGCDVLETVNISKGVTRLNRGTFSICPRLKEIEIPDSVTFIGESAFFETGFESIDLPDSVTEIDKAAFYGCKNLKSFVFPAGVTKISHGVLDNCMNLKEIEITNPSTDLSEFEVYKNYEKVIFPDGMTIDDETLAKIFQYSETETSIRYQGCDYADYEALANVRLSSSLGGYSEDIVGDYSNSSTVLVNVQMFVEDVRNLDKDDSNKTGKVFSFIAHDYQYDNVYADVHWEDDCWKMKVWMDDGWSISGHFDDRFLFYED